MNSDATWTGDDRDRVEAFVVRWRGREGGQERANYALFLVEFCDALGLPKPDPAGATTEGNDYVFERTVVEPARDGASGLRRIDLYKRGCFVLEAKQSRLKGGAKEIVGQAALPFVTDAAPGRRGAEGAWDVLMFNARRQAEGYVPLLPKAHEPPPFVLVCDVGHCFEVYANFRRDGRVCEQFPDRRSFRIDLEDLRDPLIRDRLRRIWTDPTSLDPARHRARVTRAIAERLAAVSKALEARRFLAEDVASFLTRCLFTMFAEDIGLLPEASFRSVLERCEADPGKFVPMVKQLWTAMDVGDFAYAIEARVRQFNGAFFKDRTVLPLGREEIGELRRAAESDWREVDPSIFGALLEQALDPRERRRLGAHYTPRAYVERLVVATVIEPLRADWFNEWPTAERLKAAGRPRDAAAVIERFHAKLCATRVLDPACGTANFLYVALELMKKLEGEVLEALWALGGQESLSGLEGHTVDPHQFLGLEINPRAAAIAELVLWIGHLQWYARTRGGAPNDPILRAFENIVVRDAVLDADKVLARDAGGRLIVRAGPDGAPIEAYEYRDPRRPEWPDAEFVVGNPPFIGGKDLRARLGDGYAEALWAAHADMNESADFVMFWWDHAAGLLNRPGAILRRFGFVTTNSIGQVFQRRVVQRHLSAKAPISIVMAIPDHPWTKASPKAAAVRIAMTVCEAGHREGSLQNVTREAGLDTDAPIIDLDARSGAINADLTVGIDLALCVPLLGNEGLSSRGMSLHGSGFIITPAQGAHLGLGRRPGLERHIRPYRNGRDLTARPRDVLVIDLFGLAAGDVRQRFPEVYQHLLATVKPERDANNRASYRHSWWVFGEPRRELRPALDGLPRYVATVETAKHRVFQFLDASILPDNMLVAIGTDDAFHLGVLSSGIHAAWALRAGGWLGVGNDPRYSKSRCFDPFPFPEADDLHTRRIRALAEELDAHRKRVLAEHAHLTLTRLYNVLERVREGTPSTPESLAAPPALDEGSGRGVSRRKASAPVNPHAEEPGVAGRLEARGFNVQQLTPDERRVFDDGLVLILKELHDDLDRAVADAYGWPADLAADEILVRLVALNHARAEEEARGLVRWLRPDYQARRFGAVAGRQELDLAGGVLRPALATVGVKQAYPTDESQQTAAVIAALARATGPLDALALASRFRQGRRVAPRIAAVLDSLYRMGEVGTADGRSFRLLRAA